MQCGENNEKNHKRPFTVIVEGNIGCGKTTLLNYFNRFSDVCVLSEPIEQWRNCNGHNLLHKMYEDPEKWSFAFQSYVQLTMVSHHTMSTPHRVKLMERSIYSARNCFVEKMSRDGILAPASKSVIDEWSKWIQKTVDVGVDLIVYLRTDPEVAYERLLARNRSEEKHVSFAYINELHTLHEDWLYYKKLFWCPAPVLVIDANLDRGAMVEEYMKYEPKIRNIVAINT